MLELTNESLTGPGAALIIMATGFALFWRYIHNENKTRREDYIAQRKEDQAERERQLTSHETTMRELRVAFETSLDKVTTSFQHSIDKAYERETASERLAEERFKLVLLDRLSNKDVKP